MKQKIAMCVVQYRNSHAILWLLRIIFSVALHLLPSYVVKVQAYIFVTPAFFIVQLILTLIF